MDLTITKHKEVIWAARRSNDAEEADVEEERNYDQEPAKEEEEEGKQVEYRSKRRQERSWR